MSTINFIRRNLPEPLEKASKDLRMKERLVQRIYSVVPQRYKNKYHYKEAISRVKAIFYHFDRGTSIIHLIDMSGVTDNELERWKKLNDDALTYKALCE